MRFSPIFRLVLSSWKAIPTARFGGVRLRPGDRRAASARAYLEALGVHADRLKTAELRKGTVAAFGINSGMLAKEPANASWCRGTAVGTN